MITIYNIYNQWSYPCIIEPRVVLPWRQYYTAATTTYPHRATCIVSVCNKISEQCNIKLLKYRSTYRTNRISALRWQRRRRARRRQRRKRFEPVRTAIAQRSKFPKTRTVVIVVNHRPQPTVVVSRCVRAFSKCTCSNLPLIVIFVVVLVIVINCCCCSCAGFKVLFLRSFWNLKFFYSFSRSVFVYADRPARARTGLSTRQRCRNRCDYERRVRSFVTTRERTHAHYQSSRTCLHTLVLI